MKIHTFTIKLTVVTEGLSTTTPEVADAFVDMIFEDLNNDGTIIAVESKSYRREGELEDA